MSEAVARRAHAPAKSNEALVIGASSLGTLFEWYDFFLYGALASAVARHFFSGVNEATAFILALAAFAAGFLVRPFGALVFGRVGDVVGRKYAFVVTMAIMGLATFCVGLLPTYSEIGVAAPIILVLLRMLQGLAIGGEYGGAAIYVAEHSPADRRGFNTSWINASGTCGLILALLVIMAARMLLPAGAFEDWGWRVPFLASILLLAVSIWIRLRLSESPVFRRMKEERAIARAPLAEALGRWGNLKLVLSAMVGAIIGATVIWYTGHFYSLFFLERILKLDQLTVTWLITLALLAGAPSYLFFGWLSDRIGRKPVILAGGALAALSFFPVFHALSAAANPALAHAQAAAPIIVRADPRACSFQFDPLGRQAFDRTACDIAKAFLSRAGVSYRNETPPPGAAPEVHVGDRIVRPPDPRQVPDRAAAIAAFQAEAQAALDEAGYPAAADPAAINRPLVVAIVAFLVMCSAMTYAPLAALLVELFPARIRYTSLSVPYHLGVGWVGGFLPTTAFAIVAATGDVYSGLWYPLVVIAVSLVVLFFCIPETRGRDIET